MQSDAINDVSARDGRWLRLPGDEWDCYDALPPAVRQRLQQHAYDGWAVNALHLWRRFRRKSGHSARATASLLRFLDQCEAAERAAFAADYASATGCALPHEAAGVSVLRAGQAAPR